MEAITKESIEELQTSSEKLGVLKEQGRILEGLKHFWCGERLCSKHPVDMGAVIEWVGKGE